MTPTVDNYAMRILADNGCDCYTYGGESGETIVKDLKEAYPDGMEHGYGYVEVANAILQISRVKPIKRSPYHMIYDGDSFCDGVDCESYEEAKDQAEECLVNWMVEERETWKDIFNPTEKELDNYNYMICNCCTWIEKYNPATDTYEEYGGLSYEDEERIGWKELTMEDIEKEREELNNGI